MDLDRTTSIPIGRIILSQVACLEALSRLKINLFSKRLIGNIESGYIEFRDQIVYFRKTCLSAPRGVRWQN